MPERHRRSRAWRRFVAALEIRPSAEVMGTRLRWVQTILGSVVAYYLILSIVSGFKLATYLNSAGLVTWLVVQCLRVRYKKTEAACWLTVVMATLIVSGTAMIDGQAKAHSLWFFPVLPLMAGQLLGNRAVIITAIASFLAGGAVMASEQWVTIPPEYPDSMSDLVQLRISVLLVCCGVSISAKRTFRGQAEQMDRQASELNAVRLERDEARRSASIFLTSMSGHARAPLAQLVTQTKAIESRAGASQADLARDAALSAQQVSRLVHDILDLSDLENSRLNLHPTVFSLSEVLEDLRAWFETQPSQGVELRLVASQPEMSVMMDRSRLFQICTRLMDNALKFSEADALVVSFQWGAARRDGTELWVRVQDNGVGISSECQQQVMERFAFYCDTQANQDKGAGISFVLIRRLVQAMGGDVSFEQPGDGQGTCVRVQLVSAGPLHQAIAA